MYLISARSEVGTGRYGPQRTQGVGGYFLVECSGNSASATLLASPHGGGHWMPVTACALGAGQTATGQILDMWLPYVMGRVDWVSAGTLAGTVTMIYVPRGNDNAF